jgi:2,4-dichlorophenol 6-monooxygenase
MSHDVDVLVVGSGPTGLTTALALATYGVSVRVLTKRNWLADTPRAHITNQRALEVFRDLGVQEELAALAVPWELMGDTVFATSLTGSEIARLSTWGTGAGRATDYLSASPCPLMDIPQTRVEPVLLNNAAARGALISFSTEYLAHVQDDDGVTTTLRDRTSGRDYTVRSRYLVGADGARSSVAEHLGLPFEGHTARAGTLYTLFRADLSQYVAHRPSILYWLIAQGTGFGEIGMGLLRTVRPWDEWIAGWGFDMSAGDPDTDPESVRDRIRAMVGVPDLEVTIDWSYPWYVNQSHATAYSSGRVLCAGDAVHRHPPSGGLGSNTCVGDAFNLAWKLAYVVKGRADPSLLETYGAERVPVGEQVVARANASRRSFAALHDAISEPGTAQSVDAAVAKLLDPGPPGVAARRAVREAIELRNYEFNAQGVELNQRYTSGAVLVGEDAPEIWARDRELYAQASTRPGAKMPHAWLVDRSGRRVSTLDVTGKGRFTLVTSIAGVPWAEAVERLALDYLRLVVVDAPGAQDAYGAWARVREIQEDGALLVRPDGFVAARWHSCPSALGEAEAALTEALSTVLGFPG